MLEHSSDAVALGTNRRNVRRVLSSAAVVSVLSFPLNLFVLPFVLDRVTLQQYGVWATLGAIMSIAQLTDFGISTDIARRVADAYGRRSDEEINDIVQRGLTVLTVLALSIVSLGALLGPTIVELLFPTTSGSDQQAILHVYLGMLILIGLGLVLSGYLAVLGGFQRLDFSTWGGLAGLLAGAATTVVAAAAGADLWALFAGACARSLVSWAFPVAGLRRLRPELGFRLQRVSPRDALMYFGMPAMLVVASSANLAQYELDKFVISHFRGATDAGLYQLGLNLVLQAQALALVPLGVMLAATAELHATNPTLLRRLERATGTATLAITAIAMGGLLTYSDSFFLIWLGPEYDVGAYVAELLAVATLIAFIGAPWYYRMLGRGRYRHIMLGSLTTLAVNLICTVTLTSRLGVTGALIGSILGSTLMLIVWWLVLRGESQPLLRPAVRPYASVGIVTCAALFVTQSWKPANWVTLSAAVASFVLAALVALRLAGALPVRVERRRYTFTLSASDEG